MAQRDYVSRSSSPRKRQQNSGKKKLLVTLILVIVIVFAVALFFLKERSPVNQQEITADPAVNTSTTTKKSALPSRPEEVWSYIKQLETREVPVDDNVSSISKNVQLTDEQKKILLQLEQEKLAEQKAQAQKAQEQAKLQQELAKAQQEQAKQQAIQQRQAEKERNANRQQSQSIAPAKTVVSEAKTADNSQSNKNADKSGRKYGLQCGAFKNKPQAENLQARLVMSGFNAFTKSSADWTRVFVGPVDSYNTAASNKSALAGKGVDCVVVGM
ncbi:cell division protein FtsN [Gallibacterium genomosp. 1]|uniref:Cell division protein FtsN n=1 Tax=Gallibacterium genomosp. 1 TaxID=155515 RepID=A0A0A2YGH0_9PAST|nr:cell division protein FtsN [Gallibacterium genomosp. 1]KGQ36459.1 cell division protein FtsN [Gallibacterium genomosp. 1]